MRYPISFNSWYRVLSIALGLPPSKAFVEIEDDEIRVQMGWAFRSRFPRSAVISAQSWKPAILPLSRGVHGFKGRWLVNGSGQGIVVIELNSCQRGYVMGVSVRLERLAVSMADPESLIQVLETPD